MTPTVCPQEDPHPWGCSCSSLLKSLATPSLVSTTHTYLDSKGTSHIWSERETVSALPPAYTPPEACCDSCNIVAEDVRVLYWPIETSINGTFTITTTPSMQYTLNSNNVELYVHPSCRALLDPANRLKRIPLYLCGLPQPACY